MAQSMQKNVENKRKASFMCILAKSNNPSTNPVLPRELWRVLFKQVITYSALPLNKYSPYIFQIQDDWSAQDQSLTSFFMLMLSSSDCWLGDTNTC